MLQIFILQHHTLLCFPLQHVSLYDILQLILLYFPETVFFCQYYSMILIILARNIYFTEAYVMNLYAIKKSANTDPFRFHTVTMTAVYRIILRVYRCTGTVKWN